MPEQTILTATQATPIEVEYADGVVRIAGTLREAFTSAIATALEDHRILLSSVLARRLTAPIGELESLLGAASTAMPVHTKAPTPPTSTGRRTAREMVLEILDSASEPLSFADVKAAVAMAGGSEQAAHKVRTSLIKQAAIVNRRGLYVITDVGREMRAAYG